MTIENDLLVEINTARTRPQHYVQYLETRRRMYCDKRLEVPGKPPMMTKDGVKAADEAINFLRTQKPGTEITHLSNCMSLAALDHVHDIGAAGVQSPLGTDDSTVVDRLARYGKTHGDSIAEVMNYGEGNARDICVSLLIDDGVEHRDNREAIFSKEFTYVGIAHGPHSVMEHVACIIFCPGFFEGKDHPKYKEKKEKLVGGRMNTDDDPNATFYLEKVTLDEDEDEDFAYEEVEVDSESDHDEVDADLEAVIESLRKKDTDMELKYEAPKATLDAKTEKRPEVVDDFIRNYLIKMGMGKTLETFQTEWFELEQTGQLDEEDSSVVPDIYLRNQELDTQLKAMHLEAKKAKEIANKAKGTWDKFRKERDFHRMHHRRVVQEKNKLVNDVKRLKNHYSKYEPALQELRVKYECAMKEKMLTRLEKDRLALKVSALEAQISEMHGDATAGARPVENAKKKRNPKDSTLPAEDRVNPYLQRDYEAPGVESTQLSKTFKGHHMSISGLAIHPRKPILATASDDSTWKMWAVPSGDLIMSGDGHKDWVAGIDFHPSGTTLATASGDATVKVWSFASSSCSHTFTDHTQACWDVAFHDCGDFLASCSMDHTARLFDLNSSRCRQTFRGHVDSVNSVCFQPYSNNLCTASSDKTVSLWDARSGLCIQTFYGHMNSCNSAVFSLRGDTIASSDADGVVKIWDVRMVTERSHVDCGPHPSNKIAFDPSGSLLAVSSDDGGVKIWDLTKDTMVNDLKGHEEPVQAVLFDPNNRFLVTSSSDCSFRLWNLQ